MQSGFYIVQHGHVMEETDVLEGTCDALLVDLLTAETRDVVSVEEDLTAGRLIYAGQEVKYGRLTGTIRADQTVELILFDLHMEIINCLQTTEGDAQCFNV